MSRQVGEHKIDRQVPIPVYGKWKKLYNEMKEGDSVLLTHNQAITFTQSWKNQKPRDSMRLIRRQESHSQTRVWKVREE